MVTFVVSQRRGSELGNDLGCDQQGFFVAGYERAGVFTGTQSAGFPLSSALCCRPCFAAPDSNDDSEAAAADVVAVVSTGCTQSRWVNGGQECPGDTFIVGYEHAVLGAPIERYYPVGQATCCRPALLLRNGTQRLLGRCPQGCGPQALGSQVSCSPNDDTASVQIQAQLLHGWTGVLREPGAQLGLSDTLPVGPAQCCPVCLDTDTPSRALPCEANNFCSGHGACGSTGQCVCDPGWSGAMCSDALEPGFAFLTSAPALAVAALIIGICFAGLTARAAGLSAALTATRRAAAAAAAARRAELEAPLIVSSDDDDAEWGSDGTSVDGDEEEQAADGDTQTRAAEGPSNSYVPPPELNGDGDGDEHDDAPEEPATDNVDAATNAEADAAKGGDEEQQGGAEDEAPRPPRRNYLRNAPECNVCMDSRVQIVFLPCGHACACRPCARRLRRCPICRIIVTKRQKLFISSGFD